MESYPPQGPEQDAPDAPLQDPAPPVWTPAPPAPAWGTAYGAYGPYGPMHPPPAPPKRTNPLAVATLIVPGLPPPGPRRGWGPRVPRTAAPPRPRTRHA